MILPGKHCWFCWWPAPAPAPSPEPGWRAAYGCYNEPKNMYKKDNPINPFVNKDAPTASDIARSRKPKFRYTHYFSRYISCLWSRKLILLLILDFV